MLLALPVELVKAIFDQIGSDFFQEDVSRLTVSKQWLKFALPTCFSSIRLSQQGLQRFTSSGQSENRSLLVENVEYLHLELKGYQAGTYPSQTAGAKRSFQDGPGAGNEQNDTSTRGPSGSSTGDQHSPTTTTTTTRNDGALRSWVTALNEDIDKLGSAARCAPKLRTLSVTALNSISLTGHVDEYLLLKGIKGLVYIQTLSTLRLDCLTGLICAPGASEDASHLCPTIGTLLGHLHTLHIRMPKICPKALKISNSGKPPVRLQAVVVNLSLMADTAVITSVSHSKSCETHGGGVLDLMAAMQKEAECLLTQAASLRVMRIITHSLPQFKIRSFDVRDGNVRELGENMAWDEDGQILKDSSPESSPIEDDSSDFWDD